MLCGCCIIQDVHIYIHMCTYMQLYTPHQFTDINICVYMPDYMMDEDVYL